MIIKTFIQTIMANQQNFPNIKCLINGFLQEIYEIIIKYHHHHHILGFHRQHISIQTT